MSYKMLYLARRAKNVAWADWPRTWRSHAIFASQFPAMSGTIDWMRYCTRIDAPEAASLPVSADHDGVSVAQAPILDTFYGKGFSPEQRALIDEDELRVFDRYTPEFSFFCTEFLILPGEPSEIAIFRFHRRTPEISREKFESDLKSTRAAASVPLSQQSGAQRAALNFTLAGPPKDFPFEAIEEIWFATLPQAAAYLTDPETPGADLTMLTRPTHRWPKPPKP